MKLYILNDTSCKETLIKSLLQIKNICLLSLLLSPVLTFSLSAEDIFSYRIDKKIPKDLERIYNKGLTFLKSTQTEGGSWNDNYGRQPGVVGLCLIAMLAHGDDPNFGKYASSIKKSLNLILESRNKTNGYIGSSMYNHGFATLALAEAYGAVHDKRIGPALKQAVNLILTSQSQNQMGAWRYSPTSRDADTTISGALLVALFAAANAGIKVPEESITKALKFYKRCQNNDGGFGYSSAGSSNMPRTAIGTLVFKLAGKQNSNNYKKALNYISTNKKSGTRYQGYLYYYLYYGSQAFFHTPGKTKWEQWNKINIRNLKSLQSENGSWVGQQGTTFATAAALLSLALNYRFLPIYER